MRLSASLDARMYWFVGTTKSTVGEVAAVNRKCLELARLQRMLMKERQVRPH